MQRIRTLDSLSYGPANHYSRCTTISATVQILQLQVGYDSFLQSPKITTNHCINFSLPSCHFSFEGRTSHQPRSTATSDKQCPVCIPSTVRKGLVNPNLVPALDVLVTLHKKPWPGRGCFPWLSKLLFQNQGQVMLQSLVFSDRTTSALRLHDCQSSGAKHSSKGMFCILLSRKHCQSCCLCYALLAEDETAYIFLKTDNKANAVMSHC